MANASATAAAAGVKLERDKRLQRFLSDASHVTPRKRLRTLLEYIRTGTPEEVHRLFRTCFQRIYEVLTGVVTQYEDLKRNAGKANKDAWSLRRKHVTPDDWRDFFYVLAQLLMRCSSLVAKGWEHAGFVSLFRRLLNPGHADVIRYAGVADYLVFMDILLKADTLEADAEDESPAALMSAALEAIRTGTTAPGTPSSPHPDNGMAAETPSVELMANLIEWQRVQAADPLWKAVFRGRRKTPYWDTVDVMQSLDRSEEAEDAPQTPPHEGELRIFDHFLAFSIHGARGCFNTPASEVIQEQQPQAPNGDDLAVAFRSRVNQARPDLVHADVQTHFQAWLGLLDTHVLPIFAHPNAAKPEEPPRYVMPLSMQLRLESWFAVVLSRQDLTDATCGPSGRTVYEKLLEARFSAFHGDGVHLQLRTFQLYIEQLSGHVVDDGAVMAAIQVHASELPMVRVLATPAATAGGTGGLASLSGRSSRPPHGLSMQDSSVGLPSRSSDVTEHLSGSRRSGPGEDGGSETRPPGLPRAVASQEYTGMESLTNLAARNIWMPELSAQADGPKPLAHVPARFRRDWDALVLMYAKHALAAFGTPMAPVSLHAYAQLLLGAADVVFACATQPTDALQPATWAKLRNMVFDVLDQSFASLTSPSSRRKSDDVAAVSAALAPMIHALFVLLLRSGDRDDAEAWAAASRRLHQLLAPENGGVPGLAAVCVLHEWGRHIFNLSALFFKIIEEEAPEMSDADADGALAATFSSTRSSGRRRSMSRPPTPEDDASLRPQLGVVSARFSRWEKVRPRDMLAVLEEVADFGTHASGPVKGSDVRPSRDSPILKAAMDPGPGTFLDMRNQMSSSRLRQALSYSAWPVQDRALLGLTTRNAVFDLLRRLLDVFDADILAGAAPALQRVAMQEVEGAVRLWLVGAVAPDRFFRALPPRAAPRELRQAQKIRAKRERLEQRSPLLSVAPASVLQLFGPWLWAAAAPDGPLASGRLEAVRTLCGVAVTATRAFRSLPQDDFRRILDHCRSALRQTPRGGAPSNGSSGDEDDDPADALRHEALVQASALLSRPHVTPEPQRLVLPFLSAASGLLLEPSARKPVPRSAVFVAVITGVTALAPLLLRLRGRIAPDTQADEAFLAELLATGPAGKTVARDAEVHLALLERCGAILAAATDPAPRRPPAVRCLAIGSLALLLQQMVRLWRAEQSVEAGGAHGASYRRLLAAGVVAFGRSLGDDHLGIALTAAQAVTNLSDAGKDFAELCPELVVASVQLLCVEGLETVAALLGTGSDEEEDSFLSRVSNLQEKPGPSFLVAASTTHLLLSFRSSRTEFEEANAAVEDHPPADSAAALTLRASTLLEGVQRWLLGHHGACYEVALARDASRESLVAFLDAASAGALPQVRVLAEIMGDAKSPRATWSQQTNAAHYEKFAMGGLQSLAALLPAAMEERLRKSAESLGFNPRRVTALGPVAERVVDALLLHGQRFPASGRPDALDAALRTEFAHVPGVLTTPESVEASGEGCLHVALHTGALLTLVASPEGTATTVLRMPSGTFRWAAELLRPAVDALPPKRPEVLRRYARAAPAQMLNPSIARVAPRAAGAAGKTGDRRPSMLQYGVGGKGRANPLSPEAGQAEESPKTVEVVASLESPSPNGHADGDAEGDAAKNPSPTGSVDWRGGHSRRMSEHRKMLSDTSDLFGAEMEAGLGLDEDEEDLLLRTVELEDCTIEDMDPLRYLLEHTSRSHAHLCPDDPSLLGSFFLLDRAEEDQRRLSRSLVAQTVFGAGASVREDGGESVIVSPHTGPRATPRFGSLSSSVDSSQAQQEGETLEELRLHAATGPENAVVGLLLLDPALRRVLERLLRSEFAAENLEFALRVYMLEEDARRFARRLGIFRPLWELTGADERDAVRSGAKRLVGTALSIYEDHCTPDSPRQVNLTSYQFRDLQAVVEKGEISADMFVEAQREVQRMLKSDKLPRLVSTVPAAQERMDRLAAFLALDGEMVLQARLERLCTARFLAPLDLGDPLTDPLVKDPPFFAAAERNSVGSPSLDQLTRSLSERNMSKRPFRRTLEALDDANALSEAESDAASELDFYETLETDAPVDHIPLPAALAGPRVFAGTLGLLPLQGLPFRSVMARPSRPSAQAVPYVRLLDSQAAGTVADAASGFERGAPAAVGGRQRWPALARMLQDLDQRSPREAVKVAVLYVGPGQVEPGEILSNTSRPRGRPSSAGTAWPAPCTDFEALVDALGWNVLLGKHAGWAGCLDLSEEAANGLAQPYWCDESTEVLFHVASRMPTAETDPQQIAKKRLITADSVTIVYFDGAREFLPATFSSDCNDVTLVVQPCREHQGLQGAEDASGAIARGLYRISVYTKRHLPAIVAMPLMDGAVVERDSLAPLLRRAAINANRAVSRLQVGPYWGGMAFEEQMPQTKRKRVLQAVAEAYGTQYSDEALLIKSLGLGKR